MKKYARVCEGKVQELFFTDLDITQLFHPDIIWVEITDIEPEPIVGWDATESEAGWVLSEPAVVPPTEAELKAAAISNRDVLLSVANEATVGMADAYIAGLLEDEDSAKFKAFAAYKLALNKIDRQPGYPADIAWPDYPLAQE